MKKTIIAIMMMIVTLFAASAGEIKALKLKANSTMIIYEEVYDEDYTVTAVGFKDERDWFTKFKSQMIAASEVSNLTLKEEHFSDGKLLLASFDNNFSDVIDACKVVLVTYNDKELGTMHEIIVKDHLNIYHEYELTKRGE